MDSDNIRVGTMVAPSDAGSVLGASASALGSVLGKPIQGGAASASASVLSQALVGVPRGNGLTSVPGVGATVPSDSRTQLRQSRFVILCGELTQAEAPSR